MLENIDRHVKVGGGFEKSGNAIDVNALVGEIRASEKTWKVFSATGPATGGGFVKSGKAVEVELNVIGCFGVSGLIKHPGNAAANGGVESSSTIIKGFVA
jgi:hypothetical protein